MVQIACLTIAALMLVDLDIFRSVNDSFGHTVGDEFLRQDRQRLIGAVRKADVVIRQRLVELGCQQSQRDLFSRPLPVARLDA